MNNLSSLDACEQFNREICIIIQKVSRYVIPSASQKIEVSKKVQKILKQLEKQLKPLKETYGFDRIELHGSIAKDTWLPYDIDLDIFMVFNETREKKELEKLINDARNLIKFETQKRYSEHPYLRIITPYNIEADLVPAFDLGGKKFVSATDRTIYHTRFVKKHLLETQKNECRLLKAFLKGIETYGAEIKTGGFSGYSAELLIIKFGNFLNTIKFLSKAEKITITLENQQLDPEKLEKKFNTPYIILDPVDPNRNVLAALTPESFHKTKIAAKIFLEKPNIYFFKIGKTEEKTNAISLNERNIYVVEITPKKTTPPDTIWGITKKLSKKIQKQLEIEKVEPIYINTDEDEDTIYIIVETKKAKTPKYLKIIGPPSNAPTQQIIKFIQKHKQDIAGPWIENNKIIALKKNKQKTTLEIIETITKDTIDKYKKHIEQITTKKITKTNNPTITKHIKRKPKWLTL